MRTVARPEWHLQAGEELSKHTWLGVGGACDWFAVPEDMEALCSLLADFDHKDEVHILGAGSNVLVRDAGVRGLVIKLGDAWNYVKSVNEDKDVLEIGGATALMQASREAMARGLSGLEFMIGIPGKLGGGICMNAGCFGGETADCLVSVDTLDFEGKRHRILKSDLNFSYRESGLSPRHIVLSARFRLAMGDGDRVVEQTKMISRQRKQRQPQGVRTGGSTFRNPEGMKSWELIESVGGRGLERGGAKFSEQHCNFLINTAGASASDLEELAEDVRVRVKNKKGVDLLWEIIRWGDK